MAEDIQVVPSLSDTEYDAIMKRWLEAAQQTALKRELKFDEQAVMLGAVEMYRMGKNQAAASLHTKMDIPFPTCLSFLERLESELASRDNEQIGAQRRVREVMKNTNRTALARAIGQNESTVRNWAATPIPLHLAEEVSQAPSLNLTPEQREQLREDIIASHPPQQKPKGSDAHTASTVDKLVARKNTKGEKDR